jgi:hypothetical protein
MPLFGKKKESSASEPAGPQPLLVAEGNGRDLIVWPGRIVIRAWKNKKKGQLDWEKTIRLESVSAVQLRAPGKLGVGYIQFAYSGSREQTVGTSTVLNMDRLLDENTIHFAKEQLPVFSQAKEAVENLLFAENQGASVPNT